MKTSTEGQIIPFGLSKRDKCSDGSVKYFMRIGTITKNTSKYDCVTDEMLMGKWQHSILIVVIICKLSGFSIRFKSDWAYAVIADSTKNLQLN